MYGETMKRKAYGDKSGLRACGKLIKRSLMGCFCLLTVGLLAYLLLLAGMYLL